jgi:hypothetical protein
MRVKLDIVDFDLFEVTIKAISKFVNEAKFIVDNSGLTILSKTGYARSELVTSSVVLADSDKEISFCIGNLGVFVKTLNLISREAAGNNPELSIIFDGTFIHFKSKFLKSKLITCSEDSIRNSIIDKKVSTELIPVCEFITSSTLLKNLTINNFIFSTPEEIKIYIKNGSEIDMDKNLLYAVLDNSSNKFSNSLTLKLGMLTSGKIDRPVIIDVPRVNAFNLIDDDQIKIQLMEQNVLVSTIVRKSNDNSARTTITIYNSIRKQ